MRPVRQSGALTLCAPVRALLYELRVLEGIDEVPELDLERVREVERGLGLVFGDDVVAAHAAHSAYLREACGMEWGLAVAHTGALRALGAPGDLIAFGRASDGQSFCAVPKAEASPEESTVVGYDGAGGEMRRLGFRPWLETRVEALRASLEHPPLVDPEASKTFVPRLVRRSLPEGSSGRRVRHPRFGEGLVMLEQGRGPTAKVRVEFPGLGIKTIQARFLEYLE